MTREEEYDQYRDEKYDKLITRIEKIKETRQQD